LWHGIKLRVQRAGEPRKLTSVRLVRFVSNQGGYLRLRRQVKQKTEQTATLSRATKVIQ
jgi:hypothetical protein